MFKDFSFFFSLRILKFAVIQPINIPHAIKIWNIYLKFCDWILSLEFLKLVTISFWICLIFKRVIFYVLLHTINFQHFFYFFLFFFLLFINYFIRLFIQFIYFVFFIFNCIHCVPEFNVRRHWLKWLFALVDTGTEIMDWLIDIDISVFSLWKPMKYQ